MEITIGQSGATGQTENIQGDGGVSSVTESKSQNLDDIIKNSIASTKKNTNTDNESNGNTEIQEIQQEDTKTENVKTEAVEEDPTSKADDDLTAPRSWKADKKELFYTLPRDLQEELVRREKDLEKHLHTKTQELANQQKIYTEIDQVVAPFKKEWELSGTTPAQVLSNALKLELAFRENPRNALILLGQEYGLDFRNEVSEQSNNQLNELLEVVEQLQEKVSSFENSQAESRQTALLDFIEDWKSSKDANGSAKYPYYDLLEQDMELLIPAIQKKYPDATISTWLDKAYQLAMIDNEDVQLKIKSKSALQKVSKAQEQAENAKKASFAIKNSQSGTPEMGVADNLEGIIWQEIRKRKF